uniref:trem-like transcript 2 protein isoform X1 n=2 Tax=Callithrix jacchus TaxID=9483 RepID=UPI0023DCECEB|nr:trem-like transcript 2 protein isoform X1 [Callithrix jacchus]XP_054109930.1 trem-like transcript 2 protein isoform X1 [Callithrix jacchus]XP_054109931.1 trem-like transcript 2 protein isoform X1 [Callithrix jacchus]XP_054109932.1 trem-like transcript 2 protein isoform X1 [Callithrix jacchus]XP_054109933.1 trem-like transcript 2 protein isoform X1 [Callithrix jacchus]XP_054109934.1 trem-like transcript 2 protein isoform X1 [Callithrix jacchus]XP_054109935.1 trem-like transcript 2 protein i
MGSCGQLGTVGPTLPHFPKWVSSLLEPHVLPWQAQVARPVSAGPSPWIPGVPWPLAGPVTAQLDGAMVPSLLLLLLLLPWPQGCISGPPAESAYTKVRHFEGETLSVLCSYKGYRNRVDGKVWCKIRRRKCEPGFTRVWAKGPRYLLQDDAQAKVVNITMTALTLQDSGRYWCMRNSSGTLYPMLGIWLDVSPAPKTERNTPFTHLANILKSETVTTGQAPTSGPDAPFTSGMMVFTPRLFTLATLLASTGPASKRGYSFTATSTTRKGSRRTTESQTVTASPSNASAVQESISTKSGHPSTRSPTTGLCLTSRSLLNRLPSIRHQDDYSTVLVVVLTFLPLLMLIVVYGFWKKRHMGSYSMCSDPSRRDPPRRPEPLWKPA